MLNPGKTHRVENSHWVSPVNFDPEVQEQFDFPSPLELIDSTLRKARFTAGATTSIDGFLRIGQALDEAGVRDESLNVSWAGEPRPGKHEFELCRAVLAAGFGFRVNVWADTLLGDGRSPAPVSMKEAVDTLVGIGATTLAPGIVAAPSADAEQRQMEQLAEFTEYARACGVTDWTVTFAQVGRRDFDSIVRTSNAAIALGARRIDLMDSTSSLAPEAMKVFVRRYRARLTADIPVTMHVHDDFGLATAGAIAAATAGASPDVSVAGVSYRAGFAPLEEVVTSLETLYGVDTGIRLDRLTDLSRVVAAETGVPLPPLKPLVGGYAFLKHLPGDVTACLNDGPGTFPPISGCLSAAVIGAEVTWVWDTLSTRNEAKALANHLGLAPTEEETDLVLEALEAAVAAVEEYPRWLTPEQAERICRETVARSRA